MNKMINSLLTVLESMLLDASKSGRIKTIIRETIVKLKDIKGMDGSVDDKLVLLNEAISIQTEKLEKENSETKQQNQTSK